MYLFAGALNTIRIIGLCNNHHCIIKMCNCWCIGLNVKGILIIASKRLMFNVL